MIAMGGEHSPPFFAPAVIILDAKRGKKRDMSALVPLYFLFLPIP